MAERQYTPLEKACLGMKNGNPIAWNEFLCIMQASYRESLETLAAADAGTIMTRQGFAKCMKALVTDFEAINALR